MNRNLTFYIGQLKIRKFYITEKYLVKDISIFGSFARGEATIESDLDILVTFSKNPDLFDLASLNIYLEQELGIKVDLVPDINLKPKIAQSIYTEKIDIL
jgi:predicted nucleotidyltransferase